MSGDKQTKDTQPKVENEIDQGKPEPSAEKATGGLWSKTKAHVVRNKGKYGMLAGIAATLGAGYGAKRYLGVSCCECPTQGGLGEPLQELDNIL
jgi:hypothetical protein